MFPVNNDTAATVKQNTHGSSSTARLMDMPYLDTGILVYKRSYCKHKYCYHTNKTDERHSALQSNQLITLLITYNVHVQSIIQTRY